MLNACTLTGTRFIQCKLERADLTGSRIGESDFTKSNLKGAILTYVNRDGTTDKEKPNSPLFIRTKFIGTDLTDANLSYGNFYGSDFSGAILDDCDFTEADLRSVIMDDKYRFSDRLTLTDKQRGDIIWAKQGSII